MDFSKIFFYAFCAIMAFWLFKTWFAKPNQFSEKEKKSKLYQEGQVDIKDPKSLKDKISGLKKGGSSSGGASGGASSGGAGA